MNRDDEGLPPWTGDPERMQRWINARLDEQDAAFEQQMAAYVNAWLEARMPPGSEEDRRSSRYALLNKPALREAAALEEAENRNLEPLRKLHPRIARFINLPTLGRGEHFKKTNLTRRERLQAAVEEVKRVRAIWEEYYDRSNSPEGGPTAEQIAAERWGLTEDNIRKRRI